MLNCRRCKYKEDCDFRKDILGAINTIKSYVNYRLAEKIEEMIEDAIESEPCKDFEVDE